MDLAEYNLVKNYSYNEFCEFLINKNGPVIGPYFKDSLNKNISITKKGYEVHHIFENRALNLSNQLYAIQFPFIYQEPSNLLYCDLLEHYLLHIFIVEELDDIQKVTNEIKTLLKANYNNFSKLREKMLSNSMKKTYLKKFVDTQRIRGTLLRKDVLVPGINGIVSIEKRLFNDSSEIFCVLRERAGKAKEKVQGYDWRITLL